MSPAAAKALLNAWARGEPRPLPAEVSTPSTGEPCKLNVQQMMRLKEILDFDERGPAQTAPLSPWELPPP